jgi:hypothetical protein
MRLWLVARAEYPPWSTVSAIVRCGLIARIVASLLGPACRDDYRSSCSDLGAVGTPPQQPVFRRLSGSWRLSYRPWHNIVAMAALSAGEFAKTCAWSTTDAGFVTSGIDGRRCPSMTVVTLVGDKSPCRTVRRLVRAVIVDRGSKWQGGVVSSEAACLLVRVGRCAPAPAWGSSRPTADLRGGHRSITPWSTPAR